METSPVTCRTLEEFYHIDGHQFEKQYKEVLSGYRDWDQLKHAEEWLLFSDNIGPNLAIDETALSNGELYTIVTNRDKHGKKGCLVAVVAGTKAEKVCEVLDRIDDQKREKVEEVTLDLSDSMRKIVRHCFPKAKRVIDRFHIQKLACDAVQQMRIDYRWEAIQEANDKWKKPNLWERNISLVPLRMEIRRKNCWSEVDTFSSSLLRNGQTHRSRELRYSSNSIQSLRLPMGCVIL